MLFDAVNRRLLAPLELGGELFPAHVNQGAQTVIADRRKMRCGARGHAAQDRPPVNDDNIAAGKDKLVGG